MNIAPIQKSMENGGINNRGCKTLDYLNNKVAIEHIISAYMSNNISDIELCSNIEEMYPSKWESIVSKIDAALAKLYHYDNIYCPELLMISYLDIWLWRHAVYDVTRDIELRGCNYLSKAEIVSCAIRTAKHYNVDFWQVLHSSKVKSLIKQAKCDMIARIDTPALGSISDFEYPGIHKHYKNGYHEFGAMEEFCNTVVLSNELKAMMSHFYHRDTYCDERTGVWRIQGYILGIYFKIYEDILRTQVKNIQLYIEGIPMSSTTKKVEYKDYDKLILTFTVSTKQKQ